MNWIAVACRKLCPPKTVLAVWLIVGVTALIPAMQSVHAESNSLETPAESFVRTNLQRGLDMLNNNTVPAGERRARCAEFLTSLADVRHIALFTLGPARASSTAGQLQKYTLAAFEWRLKAYTGQLLRVTGSIPEAANEYLVTAVLIDPKGATQRQGEPVEVDLRLVNGNGHYVITDVSFAGVWFGIEQRDRFASYLQDNNSNIGGLIVYLNLLTQRTRNATLGT